MFEFIIYVNWDVDFILTEISSFKEPILTFINAPLKKSVLINVSSSKFKGISSNLNGIV